MFKNSSFFNPEEALEQGQSVLKKQAQVTAQAAKTQLTGQSQSTPQSDGAQSSPAVQDKLTQDFVADMYAPSDPQKTPPSSAPQNTAVSQVMGTQQPALSGDQAKLAETRSKLAEHHKQHMELYYRPTFEKRQQQEERAAEKVEREDMEEKQKRWELQQEEQKKNEIPMAVRMATNKAEMFRGAAG